MDGGVKIPSGGSLKFLWGWIVAAAIVKGSGRESGILECLDLVFMLTHHPMRHTCPAFNSIR